VETSDRGRIMSSAWPQGDIEKLIEFYTLDRTTKEIAEELDRSTTSVKMFLQRHRKSLGLKPKIDRRKPAASSRPEFDRQWYGPVPCKHWLITKPWGKQA
jgi:hypothetical protein